MPEEQVSAAPEVEEAVVPYVLADLLEQAADDLDAIEHDRLAATPPYELARFIERLEVDDARSILRRVPDDLASETLAEMDSEDAADIFSAMRQSRAVGFLEDFDPDDAADIVGELEDDVRERLMGGLERSEPEASAAILSLLEYESETAGGIMTSEVATIRRGMRVAAATQYLRTHHDELEDLNYVYVTNSEKELKGIVHLRNILLSEDSQYIGEIMNETIRGVTLHYEDQEVAAQRLADHNLLSIPVVDERNRLLGIITADDVIDVIRNEATEDLQILVGAGGDETVHDPIGTSFIKRNPWLYVNLVTAFLAGGIVSLFESEIGSLPILAAFMPVIAGLGGNTGQQTLAVAIRSIAMGQVTGGDGIRICLKEMVLGLMNGVVVGLVAALAVFVFTLEVPVSLVVLFAMIATMGLAGFTGALIPLLLKKLNLDPAQSSSIFLTAITDMAGFLIFLSMGSWFLL